MLSNKRSRGNLATMGPALAQECHGLSGISDSEQAGISSQGCPVYPPMMWSVWRLLRCRRAKALLYRVNRREAIIIGDRCSYPATNDQRR
jgi:hypothetical protein